MTNNEIYHLTALISCCLTISAFITVYIQNKLKNKKKKNDELRNKILSKYNRFQERFYEIKNSVVIEGEIIEITTESFFDSPDFQDLTRHTEVYEVLKTCAYSTMAEKFKSFYDISEFSYLYALQRNNCIKKSNKTPSRSIIFNEITICPI